MKKLIFAFAMLLGGVCFAQQTYEKPSGNSKPIPRKPNKTEIVRVYATVPRKLEKETVADENKSKFM